MKIGEKMVRAKAIWVSYYFGRRAYQNSRYNVSINNFNICPYTFLIQIWTKFYKFSMLNNLLAYSLYEFTSGSLQYSWGRESRIGFVFVFKNILSKFFFLCFVSFFLHTSLLPAPILLFLIWSTLPIHS